MNRCSTCCMPYTRPDTPFIDGRCSACISFEKRKLIDWAAREGELLKILESAPKTVPVMTALCQVPVAKTVIGRCSN